MFNQLEILSDEQNEKLDTIRRYIKNLKSVCIAYSGGVDSTLVASLAFEQLGSKAIAITGISPALANTLREEARRQAKWIGVKHLEIKTSEIDQSSYSENPKDRCFACKKELHKHTTDLSKKFLRVFKKSGTSYKKESWPLSDFISTNPTSAPIALRAITISLFSWVG